MNSLDYDRVEQLDQIQDPSSRSNNFFRRRRKLLFYSLAVLVLVVVGIVLAVTLSQRSRNKGTESSITTGESGASDGSSSAPSTTVATTVAPTASPSMQATPEASSSAPSTVATLAPTESPTTLSPTTQSPVTLTPTDMTYPFCTDDFECLTDRFGNNSPLRAGRALCSRDGRQYAFGLSRKGVLMWMDCEDKQAVLEYYRSPSSANMSDTYFWMKEDATMLVYDKEGVVQWERKCIEEVQLFTGCLSNPFYDCPYLHLHKDGVVVLNWIAGSWLSKNINKLYEF